MRGVCVIGLLTTLDNIAGQALKRRVKHQVDMDGKIDGHKQRCGTDRLDKIRRGRQRSYTNMAPDQWWIDGVIPWSFASTSINTYVNEAVHIDDNVGLDMRDVDTVREAMKQIENKTCIKFNPVKPEKGQPWLVIHREDKARLKESDPWNCQIAYARANLVGKDINGLGDIYWSFGFMDDECVDGASAGYGSDSPQALIIGADSDPKSEESIGLMMHELLHVIGVGHTQKRQDASKYIKINWANISKKDCFNFEPCTEEKDSACKLIILMVQNMTACP